MLHAIFSDIDRLIYKIFFVGKASLHSFHLSNEKWTNEHRRLLYLIVRKSLSTRLVFWETLLFGRVSGSVSAYLPVSSASYSLVTGHQRLREEDHAGVDLSHKVTFFKFPNRDLKIFFLFLKSAKFYSIFQPKKELITHKISNEHYTSKVLISYSNNKKH